MKQLACAVIAFVACMGILLIAVADVNHGHGPGHHVEGHGDHHGEHGEHGEHGHGEHDAHGHDEHGHGDHHEHGADEHHAENLHGYFISFPVKNGVS